MTDDERMKAIRGCMGFYVEGLWEKMGSSRAVELREKAKHVYSVSRILASLAGTDKYEIYALAHDIGRIDQYRKIGKFDDNKLSHHELGAAMIEELVVEAHLCNENEKVEDFLNNLKDVCLYHSNTELLKNRERLVDDGDITIGELVDLIANADSIENGCFGALRYLEREYKNDQKNYIANNTEQDQSICSAEVLDYMEKAEKFDKYKVCKTYADYFVYACTLAMYSIKKYVIESNRESTKEILGEKAINYSNMFNGYEKLFKKYLCTSDYDRAVKILRMYEEKVKENM